MLYDQIPRRKNSKINVNDVRNFLSTTIPEESQAYTEGLAKNLDTLKAYETSLSEILPSERYSGLVKLISAIVMPNSTSEEIESALVMFRNLKNAFIFNTQMPFVFSRNDFQKEHGDYKVHITLLLHRVVQ